MESDQIPNTRSNDNILNNDEDYVVKSMGAFGKWQAVICILAAITRIPVLFNMHSIIFLTPTTNFACVQFKKSNTSDNRIYELYESNDTIENDVNIEHVMSNVKNDSYYDNIQFSLPMPIVQNGTCYDDCDKYEYYRHVFEETVVTEFDLICHDKWKAGFTQTILMFGLLVGVSLFGWVSDRFGRRNGIVMASFLNVVLMMIAPFSYNYWTFNFIRFFIGLTSGGTMIIAIVYILEIVGPKYRELAGSLALLPDGFSEASLSLFAYISPNWRIYVLSYSIVSVFIVIFVFFLPETPRWLMSKGKDKFALEIMTKAAKCNKLNTDHIEDNIQIALEEMKINDKGLRNVNYINLFKTKDLAYKTIASIVIWTAAGACYFGINQYITFLGSDIYITVILLGFIQVPMCPISFLLNKTFGRKPTTIMALFITSFTMMALTFIPHGHWACTVFGIVGFAASSITFAIIYIYASELFPTPLRNMAYGLSSAGAKIGAMVAPFIALLSPHWSSSVIFAIIPIVASLFCIILPETKGVTLMDSIRY